MLIAHDTATCIWGAETAGKVVRYSGRETPAEATSEVRATSEASPLLSLTDGCTSGVVAYQQPLKTSLPSQWEALWKRNHYPRTK